MQSSDGAERSLEQFERRRHWWSIGAAGSNVFVKMGELGWAARTPAGGKGVGGSGGPDSVVGDETLIGDPDGGRMSKSANSP